MSELRLPTAAAVEAELASLKEDLEARLLASVRKADTPHQRLLFAQALVELAMENAVTAHMIANGWSARESVWAVVTEARQHGDKQAPSIQKVVDAFRVATGG